MVDRPFTVISSSAPVREAALAAAALAGLSKTQEIEDAAQLENAELDGLVLADSSLLGDIHAWALARVPRSRILLWVATEADPSFADSLARFVGAQGAVPLPVDVEALAERLASPFGAGPYRPQAAAGEVGEAGLDAILEGKESSERERFLQRITDPETGLYTSDFTLHRLDEEFKRAMRFRYPLGVVALSFDGEASAETLLDVAGVILLDTRDVDIAGRFGHSAFLALLPHTGPAGVEVFAARVRSGLEERSLLDLVGEPLEWSVSWAGIPDAAVGSTDELLSQVLPDQVPTTGG